ncbi:NAD(P)H-binding protein [Streptomonospora arabica]
MGATGSVGRRLVDRLVESGQQVRAMTRDASRAEGLPTGVDVRSGDFRAPETLPAVFDGVDSAYLFSDPETARTVVSHAEEAGIRRIVALSSIMADEQDGAEVRNPVEEAVRGSGLDWTILRPGPFSANARNWWAYAIREFGMVRWIYPEARLAPIHEDDVAAVAAAALLDESHTGHRYTLSGPETLTQAEQVRIIGKEIDRSLAFEEITPEEARAMLSGAGVPEQIIDKLIDLLARMREAGSRVAPTVEQVTGRPARTFAQWVSDNAHVFR